MSGASAVIIGGGVSGLATAYFLGQLGLRSVLMEKSPRLGGLIQTDSFEGCLLEAGPDSYLAAKPAVTELAHELPPLSSQIIGSNDHARRIFVARSGRLVPMPRGMVLMVPADLTQALQSSLFSAPAKLHLLAETFSRPRMREGDVSVGEFIRDHFGSELLDYVAEPLLAGVYGGDSGNLSARSVLPSFLAYEQKYGSLIRGVRRERRNAATTGSLFLSFRDGTQSLTDALTTAGAQYMTVAHAEATRLERSSAGWRVHFARQSRPESIEARAAVLACPAHAAAALLSDAAPSIAAELAAIPYASAILANLVYDQSKLPALDGFGFLAPRAERRTIAAATWVSTKFPTRVAPGLAAIRAFIVAEKATQLLRAPEPEILELVRADLALWMRADARPRFSTVHVWPDSMPQYVVGHEQRRRKIEAALGEERALFLTGNAYEGVGIPDCIRLAKETAKRVHMAIYS